MKTKQNQGFPRRDFLQGAVAVAGTAALSSTAVGRALVTEQAGVQVLYSDGEQLKAATNIRADASPDLVRIVVSGVQGSLESITANFHLPSGRTAPFLAWASGGPARSFTMPVLSSSGLSFTVKLMKDGLGMELPVELSAGNGLGPRLRPGIYIVVPSGVRATGARLEGGPGEWTLVRNDGRALVTSMIVLQIEPA